MTLAGFDFGLDRIIIGLFTGLTYGLLAVGLVLVYRSSRFINFAHASIGVLGAAVLGRLVNDEGMNYWLAFPLAMLVSGGVGALIEAGLVRRLKGRPRVIGMVVTLGLSQFVLVLALLLNPQGLSGLTFPKPPAMPSFTIGNTPVGPAYMAMLILTPVLLVGLALFLKRTRFGIAIRAAADNPDAATINGISAPRMATLAWGLAGAVAAFSSILVMPSQGTQSIDTLGPDLLLKGLAGAVIARLASIPIAFAASLGIGVMEQILRSSPTGAGLVEVVLGLSILIVLLRQPRLGRMEEVESWGLLGAARAKPGVHNPYTLPLTMAGFALAAGLAYLVSNETASAMTSVIGYALVGLSVLLVTGVAGELSLGQFAFAGIGATISVRVGEASGNFFMGVVAGCTAAALAAAIVGIPALRLRGLALAVTTLAFALATSAWLLRQDWMLGSGQPSPKPSWTGYTLDLAKDYYLFALLMLALGLWLTANLRRSGFGRVLVAMRDNEDAARAFTVAAPVRKLQAYAVAGAIAGLGGVVIGHGQTSLTVNSFPANASIDVVALVVVGGMGLLAGPLLGALIIIGIPAFLPLGILGQAVLTLAWLLAVVLLPTGVGGALMGLKESWASRFRKRRPAVDADATPAAPAAGSTDTAWRINAIPERTEPLPRMVANKPLLQVQGIKRSFGGVHAVRGVTFDVRQGEVVGIIGPNGAGKTTLFEIIAGFTDPDGGSVTFNGKPVTRMTPQKRAGLGLARSFQDARLFSTLTVLETVMTAGERTAPSGLGVAALGAHGNETVKAERARELIDLMGLGAMVDKQVGELSTGTRRVVELTCLLALDPVLLLLDEPSSGVAQADGPALGELLRRVNKETGVSLVVIEHDLPLLAHIADRLIAMDTGRIIADGEPDEVRAHPDVVRSYLGTDDAAVQRSNPILVP